MTSRLLRAILINRKLWKRDITTLNSVKYLHSRKNITDNDELPSKIEEFIHEYKEFRKNPAKYRKEARDIIQNQFHFAVKYYKEHFTDSLMRLPSMPMHGDMKMLWKFDGDPKATDNWIITCDTDHEHGFSMAKQELSSEGKLVFSGVLDTTVPKDGIITNSGYCNISTTRFFTPFLGLNATMNWLPYTHLILRVRGDGRPYVINIGNKRYTDLFWNDVYSYLIYTRGGPYWQLVTLPFSKFVFTCGGVIQDKQERIDLSSVSSVGFTICDKVNGPFKLEIDYIGLMYDTRNQEDFAYELYSHEDIQTT